MAHHHEYRFVTDYRVACPPECSHDGCPLPHVVHNSPINRTRKQLSVLQRHSLSVDEKIIATQVLKSNYNLCQTRAWIAVRDMGNNHVHVYMETQWIGTEPRQLRSFCASPRCANGRLQIVSRPCEVLHSGDDPVDDDNNDDDDDDDDDEAHALLDQMERQTSDDLLQSSAAPLPIPPCSACGAFFVEFAIETCGHLTRCVPCALDDRTCPECNKRLNRRPRNAGQK